MSSPQLVFKVNEQIFELLRLIDSFTALMTIGIILFDKRQVVEMWAISGAEHSSRQIRRKGNMNNVTQTHI